MANLVKSILDLLATASEATLGWSSIPKIGSAVLSLCDDAQPSDFMDIMKAKSQKAYNDYCEDREIHSRDEDIGIPDRKAVLDYWPHCMETETYPNASDFASFADASQEESENMLRFLTGQWLTVPEFSLWLHGIACKLQLDEIARTLDLLPKLVGIVQHVEESLKALFGNGSGIARVCLITYNTVIEKKSARKEYLEEAVRNYYRIDNRFETMFPVISAGRDIPHQAACEKLDELLRDGHPVIIAGNGGLGKSSLMLHEAVRWAESGGIAAWMSLTVSSADALSELQARDIYRTLTASLPNDGKILLCIDNPYDGQAAFENLRLAWPGSEHILLLMAERSNRLAVLADRLNNRLWPWFEDARILELLNANDVDDTQFLGKGYHYLPFPEEADRRRRILNACITAFAKDIEERQRVEKLNRVLRTNDHPHVSLAELIYRMLFELSQDNSSTEVSKSPSVTLDWDEWEHFIQKNLYANTNADMYGVVAALRLFDTPLTLSLFYRIFSARFKNIDECDLRSALKCLNISSQIEPLIYDEDNGTLQPKHDVIAELFFLFHREKVSINDLMERIINKMDSEETEILLDQMVDKTEFLRGSVYSFDIHYQDYLNQIQKRVESGRITLSTGGRANLCTGNFWLKVHNRVNGEEIKLYLLENAPLMESFTRGNDFNGINFHGMARLYNEWGMWEEQRGNLIEAENKFKSVLTMGTMKETLFARTVYGIFLAKQYGREAEAEAVFNSALAIEPNNIYALKELGKLLARQRDRLTDAINVFQRVLAIDSNHVNALANMGRLLGKQSGRETEVETYFQRALDNDPSNIYTLSEYGKWLRKNDAKKAESVLREAIDKSKSKYIPALKELGILLAQQHGREPEAKALLQDVLHIAPNDIRALSELGRLLAKQRGREVDAEAILRKALEIDSDNVYVLTELGRLLAIQRERVTEAEAILRKALEIETDNVYALTELGKLLAKRRGRESDAEILLQKVFAIKPNDIPSRVLLAKLYENQRNFSEAEKIYEDICRIKPGDRRAQEALVRVRRLNR